MNILNVRDFRSQMASAFNMVDQGERVVVRRNNRIYAIIPVSDHELGTTPSLEAKILKAREEYQNGETVKCTSVAELDSLLNSL